MRVRETYGHRQRDKQAVREIDREAESTRDKGNGQRDRVIEGDTMK